MNNIKEAFLFHYPFPPLAPLLCCVRKRDRDRQTHRAHMYIWVWKPEVNLYLSFLNLSFETQSLTEPGFTSLIQLDWLSVVFQGLQTLAAKLNFSCGCWASELWSLFINRNHLTDQASPSSLFLKRLSPLPRCLTTPPVVLIILCVYFSYICHSTHPFSVRICVSLQLDWGSQSRNYSLVCSRPCEFILGYRRLCFKTKKHTIKERVLSVYLGTLVYVSCRSKIHSKCLNINHKRHFGK